jgi:hypothetical protein
MSQETSLDQRKQALVERLAQERAALEELAAQMQPADWEAQVYSEGQSWRASDVLRHLAEAERGMTRLIAAIQDGGEGVPTDFDLDRYNRRAVEKAQGLGVSQLLDAMRANRAALLGLLASLGEPDLERVGRHSSLRMMTVAQIVGLIADHEQGHQRDIEKAVGAFNSPKK